MWTPNKQPLIMYDSTYSPLLALKSDTRNKSKSLLMSVGVHRHLSFTPYHPHWTFSKKCRTLANYKNVYWLRLGVPELLFACFSTSLVRLVRAVFRLWALGNPTLPFPARGHPSVIISAICRFSLPIISVCMIINSYIM